MRELSYSVLRILSLIGLAASVFLLSIFNFNWRTTDQKGATDSSSNHRGQFSMNVAFADAPTAESAESYSESGESACESSTGDGTGEGTGEC
ncbi:hypothetical protein A3D11_02140 [Candidatus Peribacteria bacterium RIFCSPHIGHO2_02_FULL_49_16]|nr:MAG: hypothetical protein A2880_02965 [Candidatus Peribacteria bacterium RIFCSPHIGHO2_01_FULL_49_38]OGJ60187.1 MAG: hypothetical protein A3D11_02140 [Candidatus Peribacteria bacterium RIFCSPHIGHO2_02_FULL_49_16]